MASEHENPPELFGNVFEEARRLGLHTSAHAGEAAGAVSNLGCHSPSQPERIGHEPEHIKDEAMVEYLVEHQIPLEVCPILQPVHRVVSRIEDHPIKCYIERGILVPITTPTTLKCSTIP